MRRRDFIVTAVGGMAGWSFTAHAQSTDRVRLVGLLNILGADDPEAQARIAIFRQALQQRGWTIGRDLKVEARQVGSDSDLRKAAAELVGLAPDVILSIGSLSVGALQQATSTIPIVFVNSPDPVGAGFVQSMAHPGGNITGFSNFEYSMSGKWAELLKQVAPRTTRALVIRDPSSGAGIGQFAAVRAVAQALGIELTAVDVRDIKELERRVAEFARSGEGGIIVTGSRRKFIRPCFPLQAAGDLSLSLLSRRRRPPFLWSRHARAVAARRRICRSHPQGREAGRHACAGADKVRAGRQREDREVARYRHPRVDARHG